MASFVALRDGDGNFPSDIADIIASADPEKKKMLTQVGTMVVQYDQYFDAYEWLEDILLESGTGLEATAGLLYGVAGVGKSTILRRFTKEFGGPFKTPDGVRRPVIRVSTPPNPNLVNLLKAIARALGADDALSNDADDLRSVVLTQLAGQKVKMVIFDEFTHIVEDRSERFATKAVRALKELLSDNHCQCVFAGTEQLIKVHSLYDQFRRRSGGDMPLSPFDPANDDDQAEWTKVMKAIQSELPIKCSPGLGTVDMSKRMHQATNGILDHVMKTLFRATSFAYDDGFETIGLGTLANAFERLRRGQDKRVNPFGAPTMRIRQPRIVRDLDDDTVGSHDDTRVSDETSNLRSSGKGRRGDFSK